MDEHQYDSEIDPLSDSENDDVRTAPEVSRPHTGGRARRGIFIGGVARKIFIGGLARETTSEELIKHFGKYGEIMDSVIMTDRNTGQPRGFGFVTYADASVVDRVIEDTHIFHGKQVEIKRTIPRGAGSKDFKTKKIFVGGIPTTVGEELVNSRFPIDEHQDASEIDPVSDSDSDSDDVRRAPDNFESSRTGGGASPGKIFVGGLARETTSEQFIKHFGKYGEITDSVIMKDRNTGQPRGFGFVTYADASMVDRVIEDTHIFHGKQVEIKRTIPRGASSKDFKTKKIFVGGIPTVDEEHVNCRFSMDGHQNASEIDPMSDSINHDVRRTPDNFRSSHPHTRDVASPGKIFIGGLARETTSGQFVKHFGKYGEITDSVIMKDRNTGQPRGFGFVTYADASVVDRVIEDTHIFHGKQVEIKRTIPRGVGSKDFKTKKIFVGGIPTTVGEDEFRDFFSKFGEVKEQQIMRDHSSGRSRGFGFIIFDSEQSVDDLIVSGNKLEFAGTQVEIKKAEPKKPNPPPPPSWRQSNSRAAFGGGHPDTYVRYGGDDFGGDGFGGDDFGDGGFGASSYRLGGVYGGRAGDYCGFGGSEFRPYSGYGAGGYGGFNMYPPLGYPNHFGGGFGFGRGYDLGREGGGPGDSYAGYGGGGYGGGYDVGFDDGYGGGSGGPIYGSRGGYGGGGGGGGGGGVGRYHPYGR